MKCQYSKCGKDFEPNKPKQRFCSDTHRVYHNRENKPLKPDGRKNNGNHHNFAGAGAKVKSEETTTASPEKETALNQKKAYENEMAALGDTPLAKQRKKWLQNRIYELNQLLR